MKRATEKLIFVPFGWSSFCQIATSCQYNAQKTVVSASVAIPSSPQSSTLTIVLGRYSRENLTQQKHDKISNIDQVSYVSTACSERIK